MANKIKQLILLAGDLLLLYLSLYLTLFFRYFGQPIANSWNAHIWPFSLIFIFWLIIFYIFNLYNLHYSANNQKFWGLALKAVTVSSLLSFAFFYLNAEIGIAPKRNILIFVLVFLLLFYLWRRIFNWLLKSYLPKSNIALIGFGQEAEDLMKELGKKPHLGYKIKFVLDSRIGIALASVPFYNEISRLPELVKKYEIDTLILSAEPIQSADLRSTLFKCLPLKINYLNLTDFYERLTKRVPLNLINQMWFLENLDEGNKKLFDTAKKMYDFLLALAVILATFPFWFLIGLAIKLESPGPVFFQQTRTGKNNKTFKLIKFRSMREEENDRSATIQCDRRITRFGNFLRKTRIDELPQVINIIKGQMSFVGPRPERPEIIRQLEQKIPFYNERLLVKPGVTGWDQISGEYHSPSLEDTYKKLQYDLYYIKNRSFYLDLSIILKTIYTVLNKEGR